MVVEQWLGKIWRGDALDPKPTGAKVIPGSVYIQQNTGIVEVFDGSTLSWKVVSGDTLVMATWILYKAGTLYKAKNTATGQVEFSNTNLKTVWDSIKSNPGPRSRIHFVGDLEPYDIPASATLDVPPGQHYTVTGDGPHNTRIRPLSSTLAMTWTNIRHGKIDGLQFYTDLGSAFTSDLLRIRADSGGCESIEISNIKFRHDDGTSQLIQTGRNLVFVLSGADPNISWVNAHDCHAYGSDSAIALTSISATGYPWCNEMIFTKFHGTHSKRYLLANQPVIDGVTVTASQAKRWVFQNCGWQTTKDAATTLNMFQITNDAMHRAWKIDGCFMWDPFSTSNKFLSVASSDTRISVTNSEPTGDVFMGGTSWDATNGKWATGVYVERNSDLSDRRGVHIASGDGATTIFNIPHGMRDYIEQGGTQNLVPKMWDVIPRSTAAIPPTPTAGAAPGLTTSVTNANIVLTYVVPPVTGTNNLIWQWWARQYI